MGEEPWRNGKRLTLYQQLKNEMEKESFYSLSMGYFAILTSLTFLTLKKNDTLMIMK